MNTPRRSTLLAGAALLTLAPADVALAAAGDSWDWSLTPYLWASSVSSDVSVRDQSLGADVEFSDLIKALDYGVLMHLDGQGDDFGMFADLLYMKVSDEKNGDILKADAALTSTLFEWALVWSPGEERYRGLEGFAGLRYFENKVEASFDPVDPNLPGIDRSLSPSTTDFLLGARYTAEFSERCLATFRGDGSFGDSDGSYSVSAIVQYQMSSGALAFGYRYLDYSSGALDQTMSGPVVGYVFKF